MFSEVEPPLLLDYQRQFMALDIPMDPLSWVNK
jgi:hypothetical protein